MTGTEDDLTPLGAGEKFQPVAFAKAMAKAAPYIAAVIAAIGSGLGGGIGAYRAAVEKAAERSQAVKNRAESGYQVTRQAVVELQSRVLVLEQAAKRAQVVENRAKPATPAARRRLPPLPPAPQVAVNAHPKPLPRDLDRAERQVTQAQPPAPIVKPLTPDSAAPMP